MLAILIDDVGFGASNAFGGPCQTPTTWSLRKRLSASRWRVSKPGEAVHAVGATQASPLPVYQLESGADLRLFSIAACSEHMTAANASSRTTPAT